MGIGRVAGAALVLALSVAGAAGQDATPRPVDSVEASECSDAAEIIAGEPPGPARPLMERLFALDGCSRLLAVRQGATTSGVPREGSCSPGFADEAWPLRSYVYRRACAEGATDRVWGSSAARTPSSTPETAGLRP